MSKTPTIVAFSAFCLAGGLAYATAHFGARWIEQRSEDAVQSVLTANEITWGQAHADGLQLAITGVAPNEASRFRALSLAGTVVDPDRLIDAIDVVDAARLAPPRFSLEVLRNDAGISLIGLVPAEGSRELIAQGLEDLAEAGPVADMIETSDHAVADTWSDAISFALEALNDLPRSKISVTADTVEITAVSDSPEQKARLEAQLARAKPRDVALKLDISAPRPVITPFTLRMTKSAEGEVSFDACSADTQEALEQIVRAAASIGFADKHTCVLGLGVPSVQWADAVEVSAKALDALGGGSLTFSDADVTLIALDTTPQATFDSVIGQLESDLPDVFSLHSVLPPKIEIDGTGENDAAVEFVATRSPEGIVQMRGRLTDLAQEAAVLSYARARFGVNDTYIATRQDTDLPEGWPVRVLAGLEGLSFLEHGSLVVQPEVVELRGVTGSQTARADLSRLLSSKLGESANFTVDVRYDEMLDPTANIPTPEECVARMNEVLEIKKITFDPGSADIAADTLDQVDALAAAFEDCDRVRIELGGHTDSQGGEEMNLNLSQQRADALRGALLVRGVSPDQLTAVGYGESQPIADNDTEEGREANRRIAFRLLGGVNE